MSIKSSLDQYKMKKINFFPPNDVFDLLRQLIFL